MTMGDPSLREEIDTQLSAGPGTSLSPRVAGLYERRQGPGRKRHLAMALGLTATAVLVAALLDHVNAPAVFASHIALRASVIVLCAAGAVGVLRARPGFWEAASFGIPLVAQAILGAWMAAAASQDLIDRNIVMTLILLAVLCAVPPLPGAASRVLAAIWLGSFAVTLWLAEGTRQMSHNLMALAVGAVALAVGVGLSTRREAGRRRDFLQVLHAELTAAELRRINTELERLMNTDVLTGVANRRRFESDLRAAWPSLAAPDGGQNGTCAIGLIMCDVDHFKLFNDCAGHAAGDACLRAIAMAIAGVVRGGAFSVARWGGEEFVVLAPGIARRDMEGLAERVRCAVEALAIPHPAWPGKPVTISVGGGWYGPDSHCETPDALLCDADHALYAAKSAGRNRVMMAANPPQPGRVAAVAG